MAEKTRYEKKKTRLTEKYQQPPESLIRILTDIEAWKRLTRFEGTLRERYDVSREIRSPFGSEHGWSFRYSHKESLLSHVLFEEGGFCHTTFINDKGAQEVDSMFDELLPEARASWLNRYVCDAGGGRFDRSVISDEESPGLI